VVPVHDASAHTRQRDRAEVTAVGAGARVVAQDGQGITAGDGDPFHDQPSRVARIGHDGQVAGLEPSPADGDETVTGVERRLHARPRHLEAARPQRREGPGADGD
jgi:hypothetical protein